MTDQPRQVGGGRRAIGDIAPKLAALTDDVLFDDVWNRAELSARDRSLITVTALVVGGQSDQLPYHLGRALENGLTRTELLEAITHLAQSNDRSHHHPSGLRSARTRSKLSGSSPTASCELRGPACSTAAPANRYGC